MTPESMPLDDLLCQPGETDSDKLKVIPERTVQALIEAEVPAVIKAGRHERVEERVTYRNGHHPRIWDTGGGARDVAWIEEIVRREFDPEVVRGTLVALARGNCFTQPIISRASRLPGMDRTLEYLRGRHHLPSLIFSSWRVPIVPATLGPSRR